MIGSIPYPVVLLTCCLHAFMYTVRPFYTFNVVLRLSLPILATRHDRVNTLPSDFNFYVNAIDFILLSAHSIHFALYYGSRCLFTLSSISVSQLVNFLNSLMMDSSTFKFIFYQLCYLFLSQNMSAKPIMICFRSFVLYLFVQLLSNPLCKSKNP